MHPTQTLLASKLQWRSRYFSSHIAILTLHPPSSLHLSHPLSLSVLSSLPSRHLPFQPTNPLPPHRMPQNTYYKNSRMSPALERARRAYLVPNILTGAAIFSFAIAVYAYTIHAVSQDEFEDVPIPQGPMPVASAPHSGMNTSAGVTAVGVGRETAVGR